MYSIVDDFKKYSIALCNNLGFEYKTHEIIDFWEVEKWGNESEENT